jgi:transposase
MKPAIHDASARQYAGGPSPVPDRGGNRNDRARKPGRSEIEAEIAGLLDRSTQELRHLARLGIRNFKPTQRTAAEGLATVHTPEGMPLPPNALAELQRDMTRLGFVVSQIKEIEDARQKRLEQQPETGPHAMVRLLARIVGVGVETADMLVHEVLSRPMRDRRAVGRGTCPWAGQRPDPGAGLTGAPDESGAQQREQGLARAGNARVRRGMIQPLSDVSEGERARTEGSTLAEIG